MDKTTAFQRDCLFVIAGLDKPHGLAVKQELDEYYVEKIQSARIYPNIDELVEIGLVNKKQADSGANAYSLTSRGQRELAARREWETQYLPSGPEVRPAR